MGLINYLTATSLDQDYAVVAEKHARERGETDEPKPSRSGGAVLAVLAVFGVLIATAAVQTARTADDTAIGLRETFADEPLGDDDGEDDDSDDAAGIKQQLYCSEELGVEQQEHARSSCQRQCQPEDGVEQIFRKHHGQR